MEKNLCIIYPNKSSSSETFIQAHVKHLPFNNKVLYGGWFPAFDVEDKPLKNYIDLTLSEKIKFAIKPRTEYYMRERSLQDFLKKNKIDAVMVEYGLTGTHVMNVCNRMKIPLVVHFHGFDVYSKSIIKEYHNSYLSLFQKASALVVVSTDMREQLIKLGAPESKVFYNSCGVDINHFLPKKKELSNPIFLFAGRFVNKKAPQLVILAFNKVLESVPSAQLIMAGDGGLGSAGELFYSCKQIVKALKIEDKVIFKGSLSNQEIANEMQNASIFVQHSVIPENGDSEGTPVTLLEASASEMGIIATRHGGIKDVVIDGETGLLVDEYDLEGTAKCMLELARNPEKTKKLGIAARQRVSELFSMDVSIGKLADIIDSTIYKIAK